MKPTRVDLINNVLAIIWEDGRESYFALEPLRRACPCAGCQGERNVLVEYKPDPPQYTAASFQLTGWQYIGGYALQLTWGDGHNTGLYAFDYLRELDTNPGEPSAP